MALPKSITRMSALTGSFLPTLHAWRGQRRVPWLAAAAAGAGRG